MMNGSLATNPYLPHYRQDRMFPFLPLGPLSIPTAPLFAILAAWLGLTIMARVGAKQLLNPDQVTNAGFIALASGIIVARLWHVVQFWAIYREEPLLVLSLRPGGMSFGPGIVAAFIGGYAYLLYARLDPIKVFAALSVGILVSDAIWQVGAFLTGDVVGMATDLPWAVTYFGARVHPVALYRALGALFVAGAIALWADLRHPGRVVLLAGLGYALVRLLVDSFVADAPLFGPFRVSQVVAFAAALAASLLLSRKPQKTMRAADQAPPTDPKGASIE
jgi:phosphatidylglycerol---prolipoprotein diacylglyceryl transferase